MLAPLATLIFLVTLWWLALIVAEALGEGGSKMVGALKGRSPHATAPTIRPIAGRVSQRSRQRALHAQPQLRTNLRVAA
jgi:hypothetical protein